MKKLAIVCALFFIQSPSFSHDANLGITVTFNDQCLSAKPLLFLKEDQLAHFNCGGDDGSGLDIDALLHDNIVQMNITIRHKKDSEIQKITGEYTVTLGNQLILRCKEANAYITIETSRASATGESEKA